MRKILCLVLVMASYCFGSTAWATLPTFSQMYYFGDSLTDVGNYVEAKPKVCVRVNAPVTNTSGGNMPDTIWSNVNQQGFTATPSKKGGNDWAVAGYMTNQVIGEVQDYLSKNQADPQALYVIWAGSNDIMERIFEHLVSRDRTVREGMVNIEQSINLLYQAGARNFLVIGVPDISVTPLVASPHLNLKLFTGLFHLLHTEVTHACLAWNSALMDNAVADASSPEKAPLAYLAQNDPGIRIYTWDPLPLMQQAVAHPAQYGFPDTINNHPNNQVTWCNGTTTNPDNPDNYIFYNYIHPSSKAHAMLAQHIRQDADLFTLTG